jgi:predicted nucleic acid-binding protein
VILIDTSAWIEFLRATDSPVDRAVARTISAGPYAMTDQIAAELLSGARDESDLRRIRGIVDSGTFFPIRPLFDGEVASALYRDGRAGGDTPRGLADCLIAAVAIANDLEVLAVDRDLDRIARHSPLRLADVEP